MQWRKRIQNFTTKLTCLYKKRLPLQESLKRLRSVHSSRVFLPIRSTIFCWILSTADTPERETLFQASGISKVLVFVYRGVGKSIIWIIKRVFIWNDSKRRALWLCHFKFIKRFTNMTRQLLLLVVNSYYVGMKKRHHYSMEGIRKGFLFCQRWYIKG